VDEAEVKNLIFEALPCATNKTCREVSELKGELKDVKRILIGLIMLVLSTLAAVIIK